jgi:hypothetical protein
LNDESLDFRIRSWLVRKISGQYKLKDMTNRLDQKILHAIVETLHESISKEVKTLLQSSLSDMPRDLLGEVIAKNTHLSDDQKAKISNILQAPPERENDFFR